MPRRRYRLFTLCAVVMVFMLYRVVQNSWNENDSYSTLLQGNAKPHVAHPLEDNPVDVLHKPPVAGQLPVEAQVPKPAGKQPEPILEKPRPIAEDDAGLGSGSDNIKSKEVENDDKAKLKDHKVEEMDSDRPKQAVKGPAKLEELDHLDAIEKLSHANPPKHAPQDSHTADIDKIEIHSKNPPKHVQYPEMKEEEEEEAPKKHWKKPKENFPVPPGKLIPLPTGKPKDIPVIQYQFGPESAEAKSIRLKRQMRVKSELTRAWSGYKKYAWMHDEVSPVSTGYRDPFCGWAATLVDSLDTLWIAGMKDEFSEAAQAVQDIDFTIATRHDIPVFETTIRYLGGLLAAYDVSGGPKGDYPMLLDKAVELAEILMGVFDTPNRMPVLYYQWRPPYSSQPRRTGTVGMAELATLSMEFTRLSQLTGKDKYYDAIDRITNALVEMQKVGTGIRGLFPERIDASGCNKTVDFDHLLSKPAQKQMHADELLEEPLGFGRDPGAPEGKLADEDVADDTATAPKRDGEVDDRLQRRAVPPSRTVPEDDDLEIKDRPPVRAAVEAAGSETEESPSRTIPGNDAPAEPAPPFAADGSSVDWDCKPQGLTPAGHGTSSFHVGGAQDSAYEYFPKQYLLLGGLEPKYRKLHEDAANAIFDWLLFRPMIKDADDWDILFPAKVVTAGDPDEDSSATFELTHLSCFVGGMFGLGAKIFDREQDLELAKQLTDGCVWAYQSTASGLMPEAANIMPCPSLSKCEFNETEWWAELDPSREWREQELEKWQKDGATEKLLADDSGEVKEHDLLKESDPKDLEHSKIERPQTGFEHAADNVDAHLMKRAGIPPPAAEPDTNVKDEEKLGSGLPDSLKSSIKDKLDVDYEGSKSQSKVQPASDSHAQKMGHVVEDDAETPVAGETEPPSIPPSLVPSRTKVDEEKPMTHEEYVKNKIERERLPPGYTNIISRGYILRPEAIESVWYMYRITGDPTWMDKGWAMWEATITATRTEFANSAIYNVLDASPQLKDEMESFWIAETLKYYYLLFAEPDLISLDDWVLNTEAHPFKRPS